MHDDRELQLVLLGVALATRGIRETIVTQQLADIMDVDLASVVCGIIDNEAESLRVWLLKRGVIRKQGQHSVEAVMEKVQGSKISAELSKTIARLDYIRHMPDAKSLLEELESLVEIVKKHS
jgi:hypothetical protein